MVDTTNIILRGDFVVIINDIGSHHFPIGAVVRIDIKMWDSNSFGTYRYRGTGTDKNGTMTWWEFGDNECKLIHTDSLNPC
mgnify:FL=1